MSETMRVIKGQILKWVLRNHVGIIMMIMMMLECDPCKTETTVLHVEGQEYFMF
jgi:hypothetical protein